MNIFAKNIKKYDKCALRAFFDLELEGLLTIYGCTCFQKGESWWIAMPSKRYKDKDGNDKWQAVVEMPKERMEKLRDLVMPQLKRELDDSSQPVASAAFTQARGLGKVEGGRDQMLREAKDWELPDSDSMPF